MDKTCGATSGDWAPSERTRKAIEETRRVSERMDRANEASEVMSGTVLIWALADMIYRKSPMIADDLGLVLTQEDLAQLERMIVARWAKRIVTEPFVPTICILS